MQHDLKDQSTWELKMGCLYSIEKDLTIKTHSEGYDISNGLAWTADNSILYFIDSIPRKVFAFDFDVESGTVSKCSQFKC